MLNFCGTGKSKIKYRNGNICKGALYMEHGRDWSVGLGAPLGDDDTEKVNLFFFFPLSGIFPGKADSVIFLCFECAINPQNLIKLVGVIFEKIEI